MKDFKKQAEDFFKNNPDSNSFFGIFEYASDYAEKEDIEIDAVLGMAIDASNIIKKERQRIGSRIRELREEAGLSQDELAEKTGLKRPNISRIESGRYNTGQDILSKIALALGKRLDIID